MPYPDYPSVTGYVYSIWTRDDSTKVKIEDTDGAVTHYFHLTPTNTRHDPLMATALAALNGQFRVRLYYSEEGKNIKSIAIFR